MPKKPAKTSAKPPAKAKITRRDDLRQMLLDRQAELQGEVRSRMEEMRAAGPPAVQRVGEDADTDAQQEVELAMIQMLAETAKRIEAALNRIEAGTYGDCSSCGDEIPKNRLQALPFAVRCTSCEQEREKGAAQERHAGRDRVGAPVHSDGSRY